LQEYAAVGTQRAAGGAAVIAIVTGSRNWVDGGVVWSALDKAQPTIVVHGGCQRGADQLAHDWAIHYAVPVLVVPADWAKDGRRAGPLRNEAMVAVAKWIADGAGEEVGVFAFPLGESRGARGCMEIAERAGVPVTNCAEVVP
jgi:hypothetical protein